MTERLFISLACSKGDSLRPGPASARCCHVIYLCLDGRRKTGPFAWIEGQYLGLNCSLSNLSFTSATNLRLIIVIPRTMRNPMNAYNSLAILCCQKKVLVSKALWRLHQTSFRSTLIGLSLRSWPKELLRSAPFRVITAGSFVWSNRTQKTFDGIRLTRTTLTFKVVIQSIRTQKTIDRARSLTGNVRVIWMKVAVGCVCESPTMGTRSAEGNLLSNVLNAFFFVIKNK